MPLPYENATSGEKALDTLASAPTEPAQPLPDHDNHHNALKCPYCNPRGLKFAEPAQPVAPSPVAAQEPVAWQWQHLIGNPDVTEPFWTEWEQCTEAQYNFALAEPDWQGRALVDSLTTPQQRTPEPLSEHHGLDTPERVRFYEHDFYVLSNFSAFTLYRRGLRFDTSEAAYHFEKFPGQPEIGCAIKNAPSAHEAFKLAERHKAERRPDWDAVKIDIMRDILRAKADQHEYVRRKLLATGDRELVEDSWRDDFWGWGPNRDGQNMLGKLWMEVRAELREREVLQRHGIGSKT